MSAGTRRKWQCRTILGTRMQFAQSLALPSNNGCILKSDEREGDRIVDLTQIRLGLRKKDIFSIWGNPATINVMAIFPINQAPVLAFRVSHPQLGPSIIELLPHSLGRLFTVQGLLVGWAIGEDQVLRIRKPIRCAILIFTHRVDRTCDEVHSDYGPDFPIIIGWTAK